MPALVRRPHTVRHPVVLRTVEVLYGVAPLNIYDAQATPMIAAFSNQPDVSEYAALPMNIEMMKNPGKTKSLVFELDGPDSAVIPAQEWASVNRDRL